jgi:hypothetical protein
MRPDLLTDVLAALDRREVGTLREGAGIIDS